MRKKLTSDDLLEPNRYIKNLAIPYMGSKRKLAPKIIDFILKENPNHKYIYDLFGGGGAISFEAMQRPQIEKVFYNELNTGVVNLLKDIRDNGVRDEYYEWIDRETFHKLKNGDTWKSGIVKTCWSFGNNSEKGYLFSEKNEQLKKPLHEMIVNNCFKSRDIFFDLTGIFIEDALILLEMSRNKRLAIMKCVKSEIGRLDLQQLEQLTRLQQLERLEQLEQLERLSISNLSYIDVLIKTPIDETVIYLDPPYKGTGKYQCEIDHDELNNYIKNSEYKIYLSGYESNFPCVLEMEHRSILSATANNKVTEKLFCNKE